MLAQIFHDWDAAIQAWSAGLGWPAEAVLRLTLAALAGGLVGLEREIRGRQAGLRTNMLVGLGSCLVMLVSIHFAANAWPNHGGYNITVDPARIAYGVMTGVGFLGAGTIIHAGASVRGLTTAAGLWCVAAVGLAAGFGLYTISFCAAGMVLTAMWLLHYVEDWLPRSRTRIVVIRVKWDPECVRRSVERFKEAGIRVAHASFQRGIEAGSCEITLNVVFSNQQRYHDLERALIGDEQFQLLASREQ